LECFKASFFPEKKSETSPESLFDIAALQVAIKLELKLYPNKMIEFLEDLNFYVAHVGNSNERNVFWLKNLKFKNEYINLITSYPLDQETLNLVVNNMKKGKQIVFYYEIKGEKEQGQTFFHRLDFLKYVIPENAKNEIAKN
jgi:hypothetical protein